MDKSTYSLPQAAQLAGISADELRCAIKDGLLRAQFLENIGEYQVSATDIADYMKRSQKTALPSSSRKKILIIDDEINFANIMKLELQRDLRIEAKFVTWGKDGVRLAKSWQPDLCLIDFMLPDIMGDEVLIGLNQHLQQTKMVVYSAHTREAIKDHPNLEQRLSRLGANDFISKSAGMRALILKCYELLGLDTNTGPLRRKQ